MATVAWWDDTFNAEKAAAAAPPPATPQDWSAQRAQERQTSLAEAIQRLKLQNQAADAQSLAGYQQRAAAAAANPGPMQAPPKRILDINSAPEKLSGKQLLDMDLRHRTGWVGQWDRYGDTGDLYLKDVPQELESSILGMGYRAGDTDYNATLDKIKADIQSRHKQNTMAPGRATNTLPRAQNTRAQDDAEQRTLRDMQTRTRVQGMLFKDPLVVGKDGQPLSDEAYDAQGNSRHPINWGGHTDEHGAWVWDEAPGGATAGWESVKNDKGEVTGSKWVGPGGPPVPFQMSRGTTTQAQKDALQTQEKQKASDAAKKKIGFDSSTVTKGDYVYMGRGPDTFGGQPYARDEFVHKDVAMKMLAMRPQEIPGFQAAHHLPVTGVMDAKTEAKWKEVVDTTERMTMGMAVGQPGIDLGFVNQALASASRATSSRGGGGGRRRGGGGRGGGGGGGGGVLVPADTAKALLNKYMLDTVGREANDTELAQFLPAVQGAAAGANFDAKQFTTDWVRGHRPGEAGAYQAATNYYQVMMSTLRGG